MRNPDNLIIETETDNNEKIELFSEQYRVGVEGLYRQIRDEQERGETTESASLQKIPDNFWVTTDKDNKVIGTIGMDDCKNDTGYIKKMFVQKEHRNMGVGKRMLLIPVESAKQKGYKKVFLATFPDNKDAQKFYAKNGFQQVESPPPTDLTFYEGTVFFEMDLKK